ncbi:hypothetical protein, partial [Streptomyces violaceusniger]|uniref:hypothetical protein n=1 Tax=Streptomyces violaceusniger TaxID=68280 RepID=UPI003698457D
MPTRRRGHAELQPSFSGPPAKSPENDPWARRLVRGFGGVDEVVLRLKELLFPSIADVAVLSVDV